MGDKDLQIGKDKAQDKGNKQHDEAAYKEYMQTVWDNADPKYLTRSKQAELETELDKRFPNRPKKQNTAGV